MTEDLNIRNVVYGLYCVCDNCKDRREWIRYVGITTQAASSRLREHLRPSREEGPYPVNKWVSKHGRSNIRMKILEVCDPQLLPEREKHWVSVYETFTDDKKGGLNRTRGGNGDWAQISKARVQYLNSRSDVSWAKLNYEKASEIRQMYRSGVPTREISEGFGINQGHVSEVIRNRCWVDPDYQFTPRERVVYQNPEKPSWAITKDKAYKMRVEYREDPEVTLQQLSDRYGVSGTAVSNVIRNRVWVDPEYTFTKKPQSQSHRDAVSRANKGKKKPPGHGAKVAAAIRGGNHGMSKLTEKDVIEIRRLKKSGETTKELATRFGVRGSQINRICSGERWGHVKEGLE